MVRFRVRVNKGLQCQPFCRDRSSTQGPKGLGLGKGLQCRPFSGPLKVRSANVDCISSLGSHDHDD